MPSNALLLDPKASALVQRVKAAQLPDPSERHRIRAAAGASLREMATVLGVDPMTVLRWERGRVTPRATNAVAYRQLLDALQEAMP